MLSFGKEAVFPLEISYLGFMAASVAVDDVVFV